MFNSSNQFLSAQQLQNVTYLTIINTSPDRNVAYKVKTTAPKNYVVKPNQGIIEEQGAVKVEITLIPSSNNKIEDNKFLVQVAFTSLKASEGYILQEFWDKCTKDEVKSHKLKVAIQSGESSTAKPATEESKVQPTPTGAPE